MFLIMNFNIDAWRTLNSAIVNHRNAYLSCGRARTHDLQVGNHVPYPIVDYK